MFRKLCHYDEESPQIDGAIEQKLRNLERLLGNKEEETLENMNGITSRRNPTLYDEDEWK